MKRAESPAISVVMSIYNEPLRWIRQAVSSVTGQTFGDFEFLIICDNPDRKDIKEYLHWLSQRDSRIRVIENGANIGLTKSLNLGLSLAEGRYIARMDADDISSPDRFQIQFSYLESHPQTDVCSTDVDIIDKDGRVRKRRRNRNRHTEEWLFMENCIPHSSVMMRRSLTGLRHPLYDEHYRYTQDYDLWTFLHGKGVKFHYIGRSLLQYRVSDTHITKVHSREQKDYFLKIRREYVVTYLKRLGVIEEKDCDDLMTMLQKTSLAYRSHTGQAKTDIGMILYILYFTLAVRDPRYIIRFFLDKGHPALRLRAQLSYQMLRAHISGYRKNACLCLEDRED